MEQLIAFNEWLIFSLQSLINDMEMWEEQEGFTSAICSDMQDELTRRIQKSKCTACNGTGWYDCTDKDGNNIKCGACEGSGLNI